MPRWPVAFLLAGWLASTGPMVGRVRAGEPAADALVPITLAPESPRRYESARDAPLMPAFEQAADDYRCPVELLLTLGQMGSGFEDRGGAPTIEHGYGLMALRENRWGGDSLTLASLLTDVEIARLKTDPVANIRGAAAVLDEYARQERIDRSRGLEAWVPVVVRYAGLDAENSRYFAMEVYQKLERGFAVTNSRGETLNLGPTELSLVPENLAPPAAAMQSADYLPAIWDPAAPCNYAAIWTVKDTVAIHTVEGTAAGARAWFKDCAAQGSVHYIVSETGTVWQMVREHHQAWHVACYNNWAIGITHEGYASSPSHPRSLYDASAALCREICDDWAIPKRYAITGGPGIMGHADINLCYCDGSDSDPELGWDWEYYLNRVIDAPAPAIVAAVSRKEHGSAGFFDVEVSIASAVEPRRGGPTTLIVTFDRAVERVGEPGASDVTLSSGRVHSLSISGCELTVEISGAANAATFTVAFPGIVGLDGIGVMDTLCFGTLEGDVDGDRGSNLFDMVGVRDVLNAAVNGGNFACDVDANGRINLFDLLVVRGNLDRAITGSCP